MLFRSVLTDPGAVPPGWQGAVGRVTAKMIIKETPKYVERRYYVSGPNAMVNYCVSLLRDMGIPKKGIVTDYFPGYKEQDKETPPRLAIRVLQ